MDNVRRTIRDVADFPKKGIVFKDITPVLADPALFGRVIDCLAEHWRGKDVSKIVGIESRGFLFAAPLALALGKGLVLVRKPGKLPYEKIEQSYGLEYGTDVVQAHVDSVGKGEKVLIIDDLLATGGTAEATGTLMRKLGGVVVGYSFVIELGFINGRKRLGADKVHSLINVEAP
ncbi:MAG: adenine phosphoribosyltransferase [Myxococcaceae bacterium]|nr:adenine phosphoribosyltransferase [Myxococcaceae bacterium]